MMVCRLIELGIYKMSTLTAEGVPDVKQLTCTPFATALADRRLPLYMSQCHSTICYIIDDKLGIFDILVNEVVSDGYA